MAIKLQCPGCSDQVVAQDSDRGQSVKCGTCWTSVPVPAGEPAPAPAPAATPPSGAAPKPMARLLPNLPAPIPAAPIPAAKPATATTSAVAKPTVTAAPVVKAPVVSTPVVAVPVPAKPAAKPAKKKEKPRFKERDKRDDDDDDDGDDTPKKKKGGMGLMIGLGVLAVILVGGCGGLGYVVYDQTKTVASTTATGGGSDPGKPNNWKPIRNGEGFAMDTPNGEVEVRNATVMFGAEGLEGKKYLKRDADSTIQITAIHCDLKGKALKSYNHQAMMLDMFALPNMAGSDRGPRFVGEREVREFVIDIGPNHNHMWMAKVGDRIYGFQFHWENPEPSNVLEIKEAFFRSLAITHIGVETVDPFNPGQPWNPGQPIQPKGPLPIEQPWVAFDNNGGFTAEAPKGVQSEKIYAEVNSKAYNGRKYWVDDPQCLYLAFYHDIPAEAGIEGRKLYDTFKQFPHEFVSAEDTKVDGKPASKWKLKHFHGGPGYGVSVRSGYRVFTFLCLSRQGIHSQPEPTHEDRAEKFFKSIMITFDPKKHDFLVDEPAWAAMAKTVGFTALAPKGTAVNDHHVGFAKDQINGTEYKSEDDAMEYRVYTYDLPQGKTVDKVAAEHSVRQQIIDGPKSLTIDGYTAEQVTYTDVFKIPYIMRSVKVGNKAIIVKVNKRFGGARVSDMEFEAKKDKFFANFHIGNGGAVVDPGPGGEPRVAGEFVKAGKVLPFWAATVLAEKKELITLSIRDANGVKPAGILRRYSYPDFKLKASYQLPLPVNRVVADEKAGRLYCASVNLFDKTFSERELSFAPGDIQIFDLAKITDGTLADLADLKPLNTIVIGPRISGLEISPNDSLLYVSAITQGKEKLVNVFRGRLFKIETDKQKIGAEINLAEPAWSLRLSPDGSKLYVGEVPLTPAGSPIFGLARPSNIEVVETANWKRTKALLLPAAPHDIALSGNRVLTVVASKAEQDLLAVDEVGEVAELTPRGEGMTGARYMRTTPDGKKLIISGGLGTNTTTFYDVLLDAPPKVVKIAGGNVVDTLPLGGHFVISPDGKYALFNSGVILDLEKTAGAK